MTGPFFWKVRLAKGSAYSALKIWRGFPIDPDSGEMLVTRYLIWRAILNGEHVPIESVMVEMDGTTDLPVIKGEVCDEIEYLRILKTHLMAVEQNLPWPEAKPRDKIDLNALPTLF